MRIGKIIKIVLGVFLVATSNADVVGSAASSKKPDSLCGEDNALPCDALMSATLPTGCEDYTVIKGTPLTAKTLLLGEFHGKRCEEASVKCAAALVKKRAIPKSSVTALFEGHYHGTHPSCKEMKAQSFTENCSGWDIPKGIDKERDAMTQTYCKKKAFEENSEWITFAFKEAGKLSALEEQRAMLVKFATYNLKKFRQSGLDLKQSADIINEGDFALLKEIIIQIEGLLKKIQQSDDFAELYKKHFDEGTGYIRQLNKYLANNDLAIRKPNRYLALSIREAAEKSRLIIAFAGNRHVDKKVKVLTEENREIIQELYNELDKFADTNPYAVLSCKL